MTLTTNSSQPFTTGTFRGGGGFNVNINANPGTNPSATPPLPNPIEMLQDLSELGMRLELVKPLYLIEDEAVAAAGSQASSSQQTVVKYGLVLKVTLDPQDLSSPVLDNNQLILDFEKAIVPTRLSNPSLNREEALKYLTTLANDVVLMLIYKIRVSRLWRVPLFLNGMPRTLDEVQNIAGERERLLAECKDLEAGLRREDDKKYSALATFADSVLPGDNISISSSSSRDGGGGSNNNTTTSTPIAITGRGIPFWFEEDLRQWRLKQPTDRLTDQ